MAGTTTGSGSRAKGGANNGETLGALCIILILCATPREKARGTGIRGGGGRQGVGALDSLPENRVHRLRVVISLYGNRGTRRARGNFIGQTRPFTIFPSGKGMAPMQIGYYPLTREREKRTRPLFPIRHVSRSMRDRASEEGRASDFSTSRKPEATRERSKPRGKRTASGFLLPFTEEHSRRSQDGVVRAGIREKGGRKTYPRSTFDKK